jgi:hypothetical protein
LVAQMSRLTPKERARLVKAVKRMTPDQRKLFFAAVKRQLAGTAAQSATGAR